MDLPREYRCMGKYNPETIFYACLLEEPLILQYS